MIRFRLLEYARLHSPIARRNMVKSVRLAAFASPIRRSLNSHSATNQRIGEAVVLPQESIPDEFRFGALETHLKPNKVEPEALKKTEVKLAVVFTSTEKEPIDNKDSRVDTSLYSEIHDQSEIAYEVIGRAKQAGNAYWQHISLWKDISREEFLDYRWQTTNTVQGEKKLVRFLNAVLPDEVFPDPNGVFASIHTREEFIKDVLDGIAMAPMAIRLTPHTLSVIDWSHPFEDPVRRQFLPMKSSIIDDHPLLELDSLHEEGDSKVKGLVHRYPDKALFLATSACPVYCRFCTRSYAIGPETSTVVKHSLKPTKKRWDEMIDYIENTTVLQDIVVSGGDSFYLTPEQLYQLGERLINIPHIKRLRFASKGLAVCPSRFLDPADTWTEALIAISDMGKVKGKAVAMHTHFNHPNEITWVTKQAAQKLFKKGVMVRNQTVLLRGVNDDVPTMSALIRDLADNNIFPYYVYQGDMVKGVEDLRTPLQTILDLEEQIRGSIAGFMMPSFVVDLPGGGGKRLAASYKSYNRKTGESTFVAPAVGKGKDTEFKYYDPVWSLEK